MCAIYIIITFMLVGGAGSLCSWCIDHTCYVIWTMTPFKLKLDVPLVLVHDCACATGMYVVILSTYYL